MYCGRRGGSCIWVEILCFCERTSGHGTVGVFSQPKPSPKTSENRFAGPSVEFHGRSNANPFPRFQFHHASVMLLRTIQHDVTKSRYIRLLAFSFDDQRQAEIAEWYGLIGWLKIGQMRIDRHFNGNASSIDNLKLGLE